MTVKKKTLYGVLAVTLIFVLVAGMSWWQFGKSLVDKRRTGNFVQPQFEQLT